LGSLNEQVAFKLRDRSDDTHGHFASSASKVDSAKGKAVNLHAFIS